MTRKKLSSISKSSQNKTKVILILSVLGIVFFSIGALGYYVSRSDQAPKFSSASVAEQTVTVCPNGQIGPPPSIPTFECTNTDISQCTCSAGSQPYCYQGSCNCIGTALPECTTGDTSRCNCPTGSTAMCSNNECGCLGTPTTIPADLCKGKVCAPCRDGIAVCVNGTCSCKVDEYDPCSCPTGNNCPDQSTCGFTSMDRTKNKLLQNTKALDAAPACDYYGGDGLQEAIEDATAGAVIKIKAGIYSKTIPNTYDETATSKRNCLAVVDSKSLIIEGEYIGGVFIIGGSGPEMSGICVINSSDVEISNVVITGMGKSPDSCFTSTGTQKCGYGHGISVIGGNNILISNSIIRNNGNMGIYISGSDDVKISNNTVFNNEFHGIDCGINSSCSVVNNISMDNEQVGIIASEKGNFENLSYNISYGNKGGNWNNTFGTWPPNTNLSVDPEFTNSSSSDFTLKIGSPAEDGGDPNICDTKAVGSGTRCQYDTTKSRSDMGAYGGGIGESTSQNQCADTGEKCFVSDGTNKTCCNSNDECRGIPGNMIGESSCQPKNANVCNDDPNTASGCPDPQITTTTSCNSEGKSETTTRTTSYACNNGECTGAVAPPQVTAVQCGADETCQDPGGLCVPNQCTINSDGTDDCPADQEIITYKCNDEGKRQKITTFSSHNCVSGQCFPLSSINLELDLCTGNLVCDEGECVSDINPSDKPAKPNIAPPDGTEFYEELEVVIRSLDPNVDKLQYEVNDGGNQDYTSTTRPLRTTVTITETGDVEARAYENGVSSTTANREYTKIILTKPTGLNLNCGDSGATGTFSWNAVPKAKSYILRINKDGDFDPSVPSTGDQFIFTNNNTIQVHNITANTAYSSWSVQPLFVTENDPDAYESTAELEVTTSGFTCTPASPDIPTINSYPVATYLETLTISGTKQSGSSIMIDGVQKVGADSSTTWIANISLSKLGVNSFEVSAVNSYGSESIKVPVQIERCKIGDINCDGTVNIRDFSLFIQAVQLQIRIDRGQNVSKLLISHLSDMNNDDHNDVGDFSPFKNAYLENN